jgi:hypothetical protein
MTSHSETNHIINVRMSHDESSDLDRAVAVMRMGGKNAATKREWSREAFIRLATARAVGDMKNRCGGEWPDFLSV